MRNSLGGADAAGGRSVGAELALAVGGKTAAAFGAVGLAAISPFVRDEFGLSTFGVGGVVGVVFIGALIATIPAGRLTDRVRPGRMLGVCLAGQALALAIVATAPNQAVFFLGIALAGLAMGAGDPATNVLVAMNVSRRRRGLIMGLKQTGFTVGGLLGGLLLPSVAEAADWRVAVLVPLFVCVIVGLGGVIVTGAQPMPRASSDQAKVRSLTQVPMGVYGFFMAGIQLSTLGLLAVYLVDKVDYSPRVAGWAIAFALAGGTIGRIAWGVMSDRLMSSRFVALQLASVGAAAALIVVAAVDSTIVLWPALFVLGFCAIGWNTVYVTLAAESVSPSNVGRATGAALFFSYAGALVVPPLLGVLVDGTDSWSVAWLVAAATAGVGLVAATRARALADDSPALADPG
jgi:ACS family hexuronate transporter-like MFS transporter